MNLKKNSLRLHTLGATLSYLLLYLIKL